MALFRAGNEEAFRVVHERYQRRLLAYARQMLPGHDAEDAVQEVFVRAYAALLADDRAISLRAWLYRIAHNRCVDELRRAIPIPAEVDATAPASTSDPEVETERREQVARLITDITRLPGQQRSALLMRELEGLTYDELGEALGVSVPAVKSLLVRARIGLVSASEARDTDCGVIRHGLASAHDRGVRAPGIARRHLRDCQGCRDFRAGLKASERQIAALTPTGPLGFVAKLLGIGGATAGGGAAAGGGAIVSGGAVTAAATKVAAVVCCAFVTAGGAVEVRQELAHKGPISKRAARSATVVAAPRPAASVPRKVARMLGTAAPVAAPGGARMKSVAHPRTAPSKEQAPLDTAFLGEETADGAVPAPDGATTDPASGDPADPSGSTKPADGTGTAGSGTAGSGTASGDGSTADGSAADSGTSGTASPSGSGSTKPSGTSSGTGTQSGTTPTASASTTPAEG